MNVSQIKIYTYLLEQISTGRLLCNDRVPTELELSQMFSTNRMNAHFAVKELERFGVLRRNKKQGTFVHHLPDSVTLGELKSVNTRRVCVLNHNPSLINDIHWNRRIVDVFREKLLLSNAEMVLEDISHIGSKEDCLNFIRNIAEDGYNSLVIVTDFFVDSILSRHPEILFQIHNNVFIFDRGSNRWGDWPYNVVTVNLFREGVLAAEYLMLKDYKKIFYLQGDRPYPWAEERGRGLRFGLTRTSEEQIRLETLQLPQDCESEVFARLDGHEKIAIVARNDEIAARIYQQALERHLTPGEDFGLLGFDDNVRFRNLNLTTLSPPLEKIGNCLAELVVDSLDGKRKSEISTVRFDSELIVRETC